MNRKNKGSALIVAIMISIVLVLMASGFFVMTTATTTTLKRDNQVMSTYWSLESGVNYGRACLANMIGGSIANDNIEKTYGENSSGSLDLSTVYNGRPIKIMAINQSGTNSSGIYEVKWDVVAEVKLSDTRKSRLSVKNIVFSSPFKYSRGVFEDRVGYNDAFTFFGPTYFGAGLQISTNLVAGKTVYPVFYGQTESAASFPSIATENQLKFEPGEDPVASPKKLEYSGYNDDDKFREYWLRSSQIQDNQGNVLDFSDYNYGFDDKEDNWSGDGFNSTDYWSLTNETPKATNERLKEVFTGSYVGRANKLSVPDITPDWTAITSDPKNLTISQTSLGITDENICFDFRVDAGGTYALLFTRDNSYKFDVTDWKPLAVSATAPVNKFYLTGYNAVAVDEDIKNVAVFGKLNQSFSVVTHSADIEIYDDIAPLNVYDEYANGRIIDAFSDELGIYPLEENNYATVTGNIDKEIATAMQDEMSSSDVKIGLVAGLENKADLIISLANFADGYGADLQVEGYNKGDFEGFNIVDPYRKRNDDTFRTNDGLHWKSPIIIGAGLFSPKGGFGSDYQNTRYGSHIINLGTILTKGAIDKLNPQGQGFGITGHNNDPKMYWDNGGRRASGSGVVTISDPRFIRGDNPPLVNRATEKVTYQGKTNIQMKLSDGDWVYEPNIATEK